MTSYRRILEAFRRYAGLDHDNYVAGSFGDSPEMATELADLVIAEWSIAKKARASFEGALDRQLTGRALSAPMGVMSSRQQPDADPKGKAHGALGIGEE
jgi:hypothetical protein